MMGHLSSSTRGGPSQSLPLTRSDRVAVTRPWCAPEGPRPFTFRITGDLSAAGEAALLAQEDLPPQSTVLKVAHHGAKEATTARFLEAVRPQVAVASVGAGNRFGHPAVEALGRLREAGARVWRADECGEIEIITDGERMWVRTGKASALQPVGR